MRGKKRKKRITMKLKKKWIRGNKLQETGRKTRMGFGRCLPGKRKNSQ